MNLTSIFASVVLLVICSPASEVVSKAVQCEGGGYHYLLLGSSESSPSPAIMLLHGAGGQPIDMIDPWKNLARQEHLILIAPGLPRDLKFETLAPKVFRCIVEDARQQARIDPKRVYVFGNSMGGYLAFDAAMFESQYFAAVAVHGMVINQDYYWIVKKAERKTPIAIYIGDHDQFSTISEARRTRDLLSKEGFPLDYVEIKDHDHNYWDVSERVNREAWRFFEKNSLPPL
ncbi:MAG TPA: prolyl oligopeptidase family serine peptidase [Terriglobales bacterium]|nr:prolyl oligopeptidase family serine peptidase [Terriglobales bacterium]